MACRNNLWNFSSKFQRQSQNFGNLLCLFRKKPYVSWVKYTGCDASGTYRKTRRFKKCIFWVWNWTMTHQIARISAKVKTPSLRTCSRIRCMTSPMFLKYIDNRTVGKLKTSADVQLPIHVLWVASVRAFVISVAISVHSDAEISTFKSVTDWHDLSRCMTRTWGSWCTALENSARVRGLPYAMDGPSLAFSRSSFLSWTWTWRPTCHKDMTTPVRWKCFLWKRPHTQRRCKPFITLSWVRAIEKKTTVCEQERNITKKDGKEAKERNECRRTKHSKNELKQLITKNNINERKRTIQNEE